MSSKFDFLGVGNITTTPKRKMQKSIKILITNHYRRKTKMKNGFVTINDINYVEETWAKTKKSRRTDVPTMADGSRTIIYVNPATGKMYDTFQSSVIYVEGQKIQNTTDIIMAKIPEMQYIIELCDCNYADMDSVRLPKIMQYNYNSRYTPNTRTFENTLLYENHGRGIIDYCFPNTINWVEQGSDEDRCGVDGYAAGKPIDLKYEDLTDQLIARNKMDSYSRFSHSYCLKVGGKYNNKNDLWEKKSNETTILYMFAGNIAYGYTAAEFRQRFENNDNIQYLHKTTNNLGQYLLFGSWKDWTMEMGFEPHAYDMEKRYWIN